MRSIYWERGGGGGRVGANTIVRKNHHPQKERKKKRRRRYEHALVCNVLRLVGGWCRVLTMTMPTSISCSHVGAHSRQRCVLLSSNYGGNVLVQCGQGHVRFWPQAITTARAVSVLWPGLRGSLVLSNDDGRVCV